MTSISPGGTTAVASGKLPIGGLAALFLAILVSVLTETLPAGLLPQMSKGLGVSQALAGQTVTIYALGSALTAIPLSVALSSLRRRRVLVIAITAFALANAVTALSDNFAITMGARLIAGVGAGMIWSDVSRYAGRLVHGPNKGRAVAITLAGTPVALSLGLPAGTFLGTVGGWRLTFGLVALIGALLIIWVFIKLPDFEGVRASDRIPVRTVLTSKGLRVILITLAGFVIAHTVLYTFIGPMAVHAGLSNQIQWVLVVFGIASLISIWITGVLIDRFHRQLIVVSMILFLSASLLLTGQSTISFFIAIGVWGLTFGGATTLYFTAAGRAGGSASEIAQSMAVTVFASGITIGGILGGVLLSAVGILALPIVAALIMVPTVLGVVLGRKHAFPGHSSL